MIVNLSVDPLRQAAFDDFYHHQYIPAFLAAVPEITSARRYEEIDAPLKNAVIESTWRQRFWTIYELHSADAVGPIEDAIQRSAHKEASDQFKEWKENGLTDFWRAFYEERSVHGAQPKDVPWGERSLLVLRYPTKKTGPSEPEPWSARSLTETDSLASQLLTELSGFCASRLYVSLPPKESEHMIVLAADEQDILLRGRAVLAEAINETTAEQFKGREQLSANSDVLALRLIYQLPVRQG